MNTPMPRTAESLKKGKIIIYPTETCYGLGTNALNEESVKKIYEIKNRSREKKMSCLVSSIEQAQKYCKLTEKEIKICREFMPGPLTLIAEKNEKIPDTLNKDFAFRISPNKTAQKLPGLMDAPLVSTSANLSGGENPYRISEIPEKVKEKADVIIDSGKLEKTDPSTLVKIEDGELKIFREGPVSRRDVIRFLNSDSTKF